jgi:hypothetical protein
VLLWVHGKAGAGGWALVAAVHSRHNLNSSLSMWQRLGPARLVTC